mgnify:CR=1 FL=1
MPAVCASLATPPDGVCVPLSGPGYLSGAFRFSLAAFEVTCLAAYVRWPMACPAAQKGQPSQAEHLRSPAMAGNSVHRTQAELAPRHGLGLIFPADGKQGTHGIHRLSWRVETGWPYYFLWRRGGAHMRTQRSAGA